MPRVSVCVSVLNQPDLLRGTLASIYNQSFKDWECIVVDDGSSDESVVLLKQNFPNVSVVAKAKHEGFASCVNAGVGAAKGEIVVLLNTDVVPEKNFLLPLLKHFNDPKVFAVGCMDKSKEGEAVVLRGRGIAKWQRGFFVHERGEIDASDTAWVSGGSGAFRRTTWQELGGMDPLFNPFYWEDIDISYRARKVGYRLVFESKSVVTHFHEEGKIKQSFSKIHVKIIAYRNQFTFIWKNISDLSFMISHAIWTPLRLLQAILMGDPWMVLGYVAALVRLPQIFISRIKASKHWKRPDRELV